MFEDIGQKLFNRQRHVELGPRPALYDIPNQMKLMMSIRGRNEMGDGQVGRTRELSSEKHVVGASSSARRAYPNHRSRLRAPQFYAAPISYVVRHAHATPYQGNGLLVR